MPRRIVVTGCGRTGTQHVTYVLNLSGLRASHEAVYNHLLQPTNPDHAEIERRWEGKDAEVSWQAVSFLRTMPDDVEVWHQVRHPLKSLRCMVKHRLLSDPHNTAFAWVRGIVPECGEGTDLERSVAYLLLWNRMTENEGQRGKKRYCRYRIEDLAPGQLLMVLQDAGYDDANLATVAAAVNNPVKNNGTCGHGPEDDVTWEQVLATPRGKELRRMAERYGYA